MTSVEAIDLEIARLTAARRLIVAGEAPKPCMSKAGRARVAQAQRLRWAKWHAKKVK